jgi:ankyrin repeat protein
MSVFSPLLCRTLEAIHACAREGDLQGLSQLLDLGIPVDLKESHGRTPLIWAADRGQLSAVEILLAKGAEINAQVCLKRVFVYMLDLESRSCIFRQNYLTEYQ